MNEGALPEELAQYENWTSSNRAGGQYLKRHLEPKGSEPSAVSKDEDPFTYVSEGSAELFRGGVKISLSYLPMNRDTVTDQVISAVIGDPPDDSPLSGKPLDNYHAEMEQWKVLTDFQLSLDSNGVAKTLKFAEILPDGYTVVFNPSLPSTFGEIRRRSKTILLTGDLTQQEAILSLLHECGHGVDLERFDGTDFDQSTRDSYSKLRLYNQAPGLLGVVEPKNGAMILRAERSAWAFALAKIKPFLAKEETADWLTRQKLREVVHKEFLQSYSKKIRENVKFTSQLQRMLRELFGRYL